MKILIYQSLGSEIILDEPMPLIKQKEKYELSDDNFIRNVRGFVRDSGGKILMIHDKRYNRRAVPGGKVDKGETIEQALHKEIEEELGVTILSKTYIGGRKAYMRGSKGCNAWMAHYYDIFIDGTPSNQESDKGDEIHFINVIQDTNNNLIAVQAKGETISDIHRIHNEFPGLHTLSDVLPYMPKTVEEVESAPFHLPKYINPTTMYQQRYDTEKKEYYITEL